MSTVTTFLGLTKPAGIEQFNLATYNNTLDAIDAGVQTQNTLNKHDRKMVLTNAGYVWSGANASWDAGPLTVESGSGDFQSQISPGAAFCAAGSLSGAIKFTEPGLYDVIWVNMPGGSPGNSGYRINVSGTGWPGSMAGVILGQGTAINGQNYWETPVYGIGIRVPLANLEIRLVGAQTNGTTNTAKVHVIQRGKF